MGRCWTWYASIGGSTRPIPLSKGARVWCISSHATIPYHWAGLLCARKMPLRNTVDHHPRGAECELRTYTVPEALALVAWVQQCNHRAYLAHRKRRKMDRGIAHSS